MVGELIRDRRLALGLTQTDLSQRTGLAQRAISDIERGVTRRPAVKNLRILSKALELDFTQLVIASEKAASKKEAAKLADAFQDETMPDPVETALLWEFRHLDETNRNLVLNQVKAVRQWQAQVARQLGGEVPDDE